MVLAQPAGALPCGSRSEARPSAARPRLRPGGRPTPAHHRLLRTRAAEDAGARAEDAPSASPAQQQQPEPPQQPAAAPPPPPQQQQQQQQVSQLEERLGALARQLTNLFPLWILLAAAASMYYPPAFTWFTPHITSGLALVMLGTGLTLTLQVGRLPLLLLLLLLLLACAAARRGPAAASSALQPRPPSPVSPAWPAQPRPAQPGQPSLASPAWP
jgi:hypothetical protein